MNDNPDPSAPHPGRCSHCEMIQETEPIAGNWLYLGRAPVSRLAQFAYFGNDGGVMGDLWRCKQCGHLAWATRNGH